MAELSIIIVSYNNMEVLTNCLKSIEKYNDLGDKCEVIVVEQSPADDIYNYLLQNFPKVKTVRAENRGFGAGNNIGASMAGGRYLLFLNPDTVLLEPIGKYAVSKFNNDKKLGLFGVQLLDKDKKKNSSFDCIIPFGFVSKLIYKICFRMNCFLRGCMYIQGADMFIRAELFNDIGRFDEAIFMYCEESDLCIRVRKKGFRTAFFKDKKIVHLQGACSSENYKTTFKKQLLSFKYFCSKHGYRFDRIMQKEKKYQIIKSKLAKKISAESCKIASCKIQAINDVLNEK